MIKSLYEDVKTTQLSKLHKEAKIKSITETSFKPDDKGVYWRCRKGHRWYSSFIDVQIHGCPKCFTLGTKKSSLEVAQKNFQEVQNTLVTLRKVEKHFEASGFPNFTFNHDAHYHLYLAIFLFVGIHLEAWIQVKQIVDHLETHKIKWTKSTKTGGHKELHTAEKIEAIYKAVIKALPRYQISKLGRKKLLSQFRKFRDTCLHCVQMRNTIAHGTSHLPFRDGTFYESMARFLRASNSDSISDYVDLVERFKDLSDIVLKIHGKSFKGNSALAKQMRNSHVKVAKHQIQSLFGIV